MRKINCLRYALDMATAMLQSKWIIMVTHDRDNEIVMCIKTDDETRDFVDKLQKKMFDNLDVHNVEWTSEKKRRRRLLKKAQDGMKDLHRRKKSHD